MAFDWSLRVPFGYRNNYISLRDLETWLLVHHHPAYVRRLLGWLHYKDGKVGVGGGWRAGGAQPDLPGFAPEGRSFHQDQKYADGFCGACAVDTVYEDGPDPGDSHDGIAWREVPVQGSEEARRWGIHANVGVPGSGESWHIQPTEIDGWGSATGNGTRAAPALDPDYPLPLDHDPYRVSPPTGGYPEEDRMHTLDEPTRVYDSRQTGGPFRPGETRDIVVAPDDSLDAVFVNVTIVDPPNPGFVTVFGGSNWNARPEVSNLNYEKGDTIANSAFVPVHRDHIHVYSLAGGHILVDLQAVHVRTTSS